jgi:glycosyltransferase involved in cell wall biosynthesis
MQTPPAHFPVQNWFHVAAHGIPDRFRPGIRYPWAAWSTARHGQALPLLAARSPRISVESVRAAVGDLDSYDLLWFFKLESVLAFRELFDTTSVPTIVDLDDLVYMDRDVTGTDKGRAGSLRRRVEAQAEAVERQSWEYWRDWVAARADHVVLANGEETAELGAPNATVIPNGCDIAPPRPPRILGRRPVLLFVGWMRYFPNADGASFMVREIVPLIRERIGPCFEVRIVGTAGPETLALAAEPNITVTDYVDDLQLELDHADLAVVPLRHGSGTRLKILEAFSNRLPVVSTSIGASGLDARDNCELRIANTPHEFARACVELLEDDTERQRLAANAYQLVISNFDWRAIAEQVDALVGRVKATRRG